jgi:hypothetical protein
MKSDPDSFAWLIIDGLDSLATVDPKAFECLLSTFVTRKLQAGNFFVALEQLRACLGRQDIGAVQERVDTIMAWLHEVERLGALLVQAQQQREAQSATAYVM